MRPMDRKLHDMLARETKSKVTLSWLLKMREIGAVITHGTSNVSCKKNILFSLMLRNTTLKYLFINT